MGVSCEVRVTPGCRTRVGPVSLGPALPGSHLLLLPVLQALLLTIQSHDGAVKSVLEKGEALLASVHFPSIRDNTNRLHNDYTALSTITAVRSPHVAPGTSQDSRPPCVWLLCEID